MGEQLAIEAVQGLSGPAILAGVVIGLLAAGALFVVWRHVERCAVDQRLLHERVSSVKDDLAAVKEELAGIRATLSAHLEYIRAEREKQA